nr:reverse transcriptase domain-containing protein [Tanacetum cinerariifolium]
MASSQPKSTYEAAATLTEFGLKKILIDKINSNESYLTALEHRECYDGLIKSYNLDKDFFSSYDVYSLKHAKPTTKSQSKSSGKFVHAEEPKFKVGDTDTPQSQEGNWEKLDWENPKGDDYPFNLSKPLPLITCGNYQSVPVEFFINNDLKLARNQSSNPSASTNPNPKGRNRRHPKPRIENLDLDDPTETIGTMADQRTMAQLLQVPTEGYEDAIVVPAISAENFELKHDLLTLVQNKQFFGHDKEDPHAHVRYFNKITSTLKFPNVSNTVENLVSNPSEFEDECECDVPDYDDSQTTNFSTFSNPLFDDSTSSDDESSHEEVIRKMSFKAYSNPLFDLDEEIISSEFNPIHNEDLNSTPKNDCFDTKSYLLESLLNRDESIPPGIDYDDSDSEGDNLFLKRLLHDDPIPLSDILDFSIDVRVFLPFFTYPVTSSILHSSGSEDTIFDPGIYHFSSLEPGVSHRSGTFMKFNIYPNHLNKIPM